MSFRHNPNIIQATCIIREINGRTCLGRNGLDDIWHYAYLVVEDENGNLLKFERVTTNQQIDPEIEIGNRCTLYFRRIGKWKPVFHLIASQSEGRGLSTFVFYQRFNRVVHTVSMVGSVIGSYLFGLLFFIVPAGYTVGPVHVFWLALVMPIGLIVMNHRFGQGPVRRDSIALHKELQKMMGSAKFDGRELRVM